MAHLNSRAASDPRGHSRTVSAALAPPPTMWSGQLMTTPVTSCGAPASNSIVSPGLRAGCHGLSNHKRSSCLVLGTTIVLKLYLRPLLHFFEKHEVLQIFNVFFSAARHMRLQHPCAYPKNITVHSKSRLFKLLVVWQLTCYPRLRHSA